MDHTDATIRYFTRVFPFLRGAHGHHPGTRLSRRVTEPGHPDRLRWVLAELEGLSSQRILDAGCGTGLYSTSLAALGHHVTALDLSSVMLSAASASAAAAGVSGRIEFVQADLRSWEPAQPFDIVLSMGVLEYYVGAEQLLDRLYAWTRGRLLLSFPGQHQDLRTMVRRAWLRCHGVRPQFYRISDLERMLERLPQAETRVHEMRVAHCVSARRRSAIDAHATNDDRPRQG